MFKKTKSSSHQYSSSYSGLQTPPSYHAHGHHSSYGGHTSQPFVPANNQRHHASVYKYATPYTMTSYHLVNNHRLSSSKLELQQNGQTILWVEDKSDSKMEIRLHSGGEKGPIVATCRLKSSEPGCKIILGESKKVPRSQWCYVNGKGPAFEFRYHGRVFTWNGSPEGAAVLIDLSAGPGRPLARYEYTKKTLGRHNVARMDFMVELGPELELIAMATVLGMGSQSDWVPGVVVAGVAPLGGAI